MPALPNSDLEAAITHVITQKMDRVMERVLKDDPFVKTTHRERKPLYAALVPDEIFKGSHFERRFVTPFGKIWEELAVVVAKNWMGKAEGDYSIDGMVPEKRLARIQETLNRLEHKRVGKRTMPNWDSELRYILEAGGDPIPTRVVCDVYVENTRMNEKYGLEIKAPLPNSDQTKVSKEKLLKLYAMEPRVIDHAYYALPYNPYGSRADYDWSFPMRWFDMHNDKCVLIGDELWDMLGGEGTYDLFVKIVRKLGQRYQAEIYEQYLGMAPPEKRDRFQFQDVPDIEY